MIKVLSFIQLPSLPKKRWRGLFLYCFEALQLKGHCHVLGQQKKLATPNERDSSFWAFYDFTIRFKSKLNKLNYPNIVICITNIQSNNKANYLYSIGSRIDKIRGDKLL